MAPVPPRALSSPAFPSTNAFATVAGWLLATALALAPWAFGSRPYWAALSLAAWLGLAVACWCVGWIHARRLPSIPWPCAALTLLLSTFAAVALLNPQSAYDPARNAFLPNPASLPFLPATVDAATGWSFTLEMLVDLAVIPLAADLARFPVWRSRLLGTVALTGGLVGVAGMFLKFGGSPRLAAFLQDRPWAQGEIFGPFDYHGNAGAFLNLALPAAAWKTATSGHSPAGRACWTAAVAVLYAALFANLSRAAWAIGLGLAPVCICLVLQGFRSPVPSASRRPRLAWTVGLAAALLLVVGLGLANHFERPRRRLEHLASELDRPEYPRYLQSRAAWEMTQEHPWFGSGVGTYKVLVQTSSIRGHYFSPAYRPDAPFTVLSHTHEDYLQTLAEWGGLGFAAWAALVTGAFLRLWVWLRQTGFTTRTGWALGAALGGVFVHALGDCPLQIPAIQCTVAVLLGLAWGSPVTARPLTRARN